MEGKIRICLLMLPVLLSLTIAPPFLAPEALADTRITITIAAGGVACGVYFFRITYKSLAPASAFRDTGALLDVGPAGWSLDFPSPNFTREEPHGAVLQGRPVETAFIDILRLHF